MSPNNYTSGMDVVLNDEYFWMRVAIHLSPIDAMRVARTNKAAYAGVWHVARHIRPQKKTTHVMNITKRNWRYISQAFKSGVSGFKLSAFKVPVGVWYFKALQTICDLPIREMAVDVTSVHYHDSFNIAHDKLLLRVLEQGGYRLTTESLSVKLCSGQPSAFQVADMPNIVRLRLSGLHTRLATQGLLNIRYLETLVCGHELESLLVLPCLEVAVLEIKGVVQDLTVMCSTRLKDVKIRSTHTMQLSMNAPGLKRVKLCVWNARVCLTGIAHLNVLVVTGHVWAVRNVRVDLGNAVVDKIRCLSSDSTRIVNAKPLLLIVETFYDHSDIDFHPAMYFRDGAMVAIERFGRRQHPIFSLSFLERMATQKRRIFHSQVSTVDHMTSYAYTIKCTD